MGTGESGLAEGGVEIVVRGLSVLELLLSTAFTSVERGREGGRERERGRNFHKGKTTAIIIFTLLSILLTSVNESHSPDL